MSKRTRILALYEKLEKLVSRLPSSLQKPILAELEPVKKFFLLQRAPRIVLFGERGLAAAHLLNALFNEEVLRPHDERNAGTGWLEITRTGRGTIRLLDARDSVPLAAVKRALADEAPDIFLFLRSPAGLEAEFAAELDRCVDVLQFSDERHDVRPALIGLLVKSEHEDAAEPARQQLNAALMARPRIDEHLTTTLGISSFVRFRVNGTVDTHRDERENIDRLALIIAEELPAEAKLEMARLCGVRPVQEQIAKTLIKSVTAICTAIGTQPIPIADFPVLTALQVMMVAGIAYISGREMSAKVGAEFIGALGANVGAGLVLREGARALTKLFPGWGNAISGAIAGAGTYAIGRSASGYFVEGISIADARRLFRRSRRSQQEELPRG